MCAQLWPNGIVETMLTVRILWLYLVCWVTSLRDDQKKFLFCPDVLWNAVRCQVQLLGALKSSSFWMGPDPPAGCVLPPWSLYPWNHHTGEKGLGSSCSQTVELCSPLHRPRCLSISRLSNRVTHWFPVLNNYYLLITEHHRVEVIADVTTRAF